MSLTIPPPFKNLGPLFGHGNTPSPWGTEKGGGMCEVVEKPLMWRTR